MQRELEFRHRSDEERVKGAGMVLDFDEIARRGVMSKAETMLAKAYGVYTSRKSGDHMLRIVNPGGVMTSAQVRLLADVSQEYAAGKLAYTTRQSVQLHKVQIDSIPAVMRELAKVGLTTFHGCGDNLRNVAACPWAKDCPHKRFDVLPYSIETSDYLNSFRDLDNLPRKYKITYSGCGAGCGQPWINCVGVIAIEREKDGKREQGFRVNIGGGMGWKPFVAQELFSFVPAARIHDLCRAICMLFRDHGDRYNRAKARLKFVVHRKGIEECRKIVLENLAAEAVDHSGFEIAPVVDCGPTWPDRPLSVTDPLDPNGLAIQCVIIPKGELEADQLRRVAELAEIFGDKQVHSTNRQNLEIHGVEPRNVPELRARIEETGLGAEGFYGIRDIVPCVGVSYCPLAVTTTRDMYDLLMPVVSRKKYDTIRDKVLINITGCPNSCSPYRITDIGLRGMRIRGQSGSEEAYQILIGGRENDFGKLFAELKVADCVGAIECILDTFLANRQGDESLADNVDCLGAEAYVKEWTDA
jgi:sulfite reductase beta subunit-like hemoprotein